MTILDNVLNVGEWAHTDPGGLLEGADGGAKNCAATDFAEALRR
jgi:hypothetical protein